MTDASALHAAFDALRASGYPERDPLRFAYFDALARRIAAQPELVRRALETALEAKLHAALAGNDDGCDATARSAARPAAVPAENVEEERASPLAELLAHIRRHSLDAADTAADTAPSTTTTPTTVERRYTQAPATATAPGTRPGPELKSVAYFHETWSKLSAEQQLTRTLAQAPENAGPMNSQHLVLRSLQLMRDVAPDYLQGFMSYIDTLIWLEHANPAKVAAGRSPSSEGASKTKRAKRNPTSRPSP